MQCLYYAQGQCCSCTWLEQTYQQQIKRKQQNLQQCLSELVSEETIYFPPQQSTQQAMRNRAKMVVSETDIRYFIQSQRYEQCN